MYPQGEAEAQPEEFDDLRFDHFFLQPLYSPELETNTQKAIDYCLLNPKWKLSVQTHKLIGID